MENGTKMIEVESGRICYRVLGAGEPALLFLHGAGGDHRLFLHQLRAFKDEVRAIAIDFPGHGGSIWNGVPSFKDYVDAAESVLAREGVNRFIPVGHSMGGGVMFELCLRNPDRAAGLVAICTAPTLPVNEMVFQLIDQDFASFCDFAVKLSYSPDVTHELARMAREGLQSTEPRLVRNDFSICASYDYTSNLTRIKAPALVITTRSDKLVPRRLAEALASSLQGARLAIMEEVGHMPHLEFPEKVNAQIGIFLRSLL